MVVKLTALLSSEQAIMRNATNSSLDDVWRAFALTVTNRKELFFTFMGQIEYEGHLPVG
ncbi:hypothetical protein GCM10028819_14240 [Spirosoma humi]